jgi:hypothetical protein
MAVAAQNNLYTADKVNILFLLHLENHSIDNTRRVECERLQEIN